MRNRITPFVAATTAVAAAWALVAGAGAATAAPPCPGAQPPRLVGSVPGAALEGLTVDRAGRLYASDAASGRVFRLSRPGAPAVAIARVPDGSAGGLAWTPGGTLLVGYGNAGVLAGDALRPAGIARLDVRSRVLRPWVGGLSAANGLTVSRAGNVYATNDFGNQIARISPAGRVQPAWGSLPSANGAVLGRGDRFLYLARTFVNPGVSRVSTSNPRVVQNLLTVGYGDAPDGLTLDSRDRPIVPFNLSGRIVRVTAPGRYCVLASGLPTSSVVTYGRGDRGFSAGRLYRAGFDGRIYEIPAGFDRAARTHTAEGQR
ncbi:hypothetical protein GOARA_048_01210 [Gordonia araii NBRC 100433]|uniref:SMP-30/Gluconolactonase/LRE-like region domain-containing protein n=1 Tax=Gordonia araii NBRC 100433 TaxID=1073574 RepID=G7H244_9ACTN|nr:hypothetical protein [Gordonia araii]NNG97252.1 hypothetical protein [Gordonia araii NBRC 100433]GAB09919.1 hypothetical protein GOARA_048_01210 [Gordonia araii NBRC 100433]